MLNSIIKPDFKKTAGGVCMLVIRIIMQTLHYTKKKKAMLRVQGESSYRKLNVCLHLLARKLIAAQLFRQNIHVTQMFF